VIEKNWIKVHLMPSLLNTIRDSNIRLNPHIA